MEQTWTEIKITMDVGDLGTGADIAHMVVPYGIYVEDYSHLEEESLEIAHIDLIDEQLLSKDRTKGIIHIYISPCENPAEAVAFLTERYRAAGICFEMDASDCAEEDWINNWKQYFHPMQVGKKLLIRPLWIDHYDAGDRKVLSIEPGLAFGTGTHATTKLCLETLEDYITADSEVLDVGCGSGILGIASLLYGARSVTGVDIDALAVKTAIENGRENGFEPPRYEILQGNLTDQVSGKYNVVAANIVADIIILFSRDVGAFMTENAVFITSGIIDSRKADVEAALAENGFEIIECREENGWVVLVSRLAQ